MKTVLIVDDSKTIQKIIENQLRTHFNVVGKGSSGQEGFELYKVLKPDIVLLDIVMPNCSGKECLKLILDFNPSAMVVMVSSVGDDETIAECMALGAKAFVKKDQFSSPGGEQSAFVTQILAIYNKCQIAEAA